MRKLAFAAALAVCAGGFPGLAPFAGAQSPPPDAGAAQNFVDTKNFAYAPGSITIRAGQSVRFTNSDSTAHTVTADDNSFDSGNMDQGHSWSHAFKKAGTYAYYCTYHSYMHGTVVVK